MKLELRPDWKHAWRWISMNCMTLALSIQGSWLAIPQDMRDKLPNHVASIATAVLLVLGILGSFVKQAPPKKAKK